MEVWNRLNYQQKDIDRFWSKVKVEYLSDGTPDFKKCMIWTAGLGKNDYGQFYFNGHNVQTHRFIYTCFYGKIPTGQCVCHSCDNPRCVNPNHLWLGTNQQNTFDRCQKNRSARGQQNGNVKLSECDVLNIRQLCKMNSSASIARMYNVGETIIKNIKNLRNWKHI